MSAQITQELQAFGFAKVIVVLKSDASNASASSIKAGIEKHFVVSEYSQTASLAASLDLKTANPAFRYYPNLGVALGTVNRESLASLRADKDFVGSVSGAPQISLIRPAMVANAASSQKKNWGIESLKVKQVWDAGFTGKGIFVGHLDTGVDGSHPALKNAIASFARFDALGREEKPAPKAKDSDEHGTHTAATIAGRTASGVEIGIAPEAMLASAEVIEGGDVVARVLGGMDWAVGKGIKVLSMSLGLRGWWQDFLPLTRLLRARNILPVFAVGNEFAGTSRSPGNYAQALSVGAYDKNIQMADFSCSQRFNRKRDPLVPDLVAPGVDILSARPGGGYQLMSGTSMATPHIAGLAALLWQAKPHATVSQIEKAIFASCTLPANMSMERGNRGVPDAVKALAALL
ncbi:MAG: S8 family serine peptidase [Pyrinomonadaceae bacterium]